MGNHLAHCITGGGVGGDESKGNVVILQANGQVTEVAHSVRCQELLQAHPYHFVCHSSSVLLKQQGSFLPAEAKLKRGEIYFLLPLPGDLNGSSTKTGSTDTEALLGKGTFHRPQVHGTIKFVIPKQYLNRIMAEQAAKGSRAKPGKSGHGKYTKRRKSALSFGGGSKKSSTMWTPGLESIVERD